MIRLIATDLDDTLLDASAGLSPRTKRALDAAMARGCGIALSSGRMLEAMLPFAEMIGVNAPMLLYNGAMIYDHRTDETLFARRFNLRLMQCDARVRRDDAITCVRDFERYIEGLTLVGGGGTDFRPAFERIDHLIARGAFRRLRAALFFSDGMGLFPSRPPEYDAVFVFFKGHYDAIDVPSWARTLVLEGD